ncbi:BASS family bile acid:Na+ symporter [Actinomycetospora succinea]|uniref:BASS family bile acid:Na+ symporter n=1 Tax=Actinomycetospora succinea TaxID=663603 RepID=A0A4R6VMF1_9PSEU|nr:bile acid:sodium symporter [Actinomycetospora succinea]TDQ64949.1 BASS family bile acid:Na+ symporter [Actinomycetospora succinea]
MPRDVLLTVVNAFGLLFAILNSFTLGLRLRVGRELAQFFRQWQLAVRVLVVNFVVLPVLVIGFAALAPMNADIKIGYCIVALAAGAPFAPALTRLARGDAGLSTALFLVMVAVTVVVVPLVLPVVAAALVPGAAHPGVWGLAWPLLTFVVVPLLLGCLLRLRYDEAVAGWARPLLIVQLASLVLYVNLFIFAFSDLFVAVWWQAYAAAIAVPVLGIAFGAFITLRDRAARHASVITTAQRSITGAIVVTVFAYTQPMANVSVTVINTVGIVILLVLALEWRRVTPEEPAPMAAGGPPAHDGSVPAPRRPGHARS